MKAIRGMVCAGLLTGLLGSCASANTDAALPESPSAEIPIRRVVLYQNGVGYFERRGEVDGNVLSLQIRPSQINDLLKSLTVIDATSGRAVSISLPLEKSGDRVLSELPEQVRQAGGLLDVLRVFRGARVEVDGNLGSQSGRVVGVENMPRKVGDSVVPDWRLTLRTEGGKLLVYPVRSISEISIEDRALAVGLDQSLDVSLNEGNWKPITLSIRLAGDQEHKLQASYIVEMPRWKPAYRLVLSKKAPLLQAWAVVDNVSGEDWNNVQLSLVAGTPMSFVYDLHSPQFTHRADLTPRGRTRAIAPPQESAGVEKPSDAKELLEESYSGKRGAAKKSRSAAGPSPAAERAADVDEEAEEDGYAYEFERDRLDDVLELQEGPAVETQEMGALFRYDIPDPVTVPDRSSTLVAIVNQRVDAEEVVFFRPELTSDDPASHPYRAVKFTNDTAFTLEKGPVALYSEGTFSGEGFLDRVEPGSTHFISYAIDTKVSLDQDYGTKDEGARLLRISGGQLVSEVLRVESTTYTVKNLHAEPVTAYIKTSKRSDWELQKRPDRTVETPDALLVPVKVPASGKAELEVAWTRTLVRNIAIDTSLSTTVLKLYLQGGQVPPQARASIEKILQLKAELSDIQTDSARVRKQHSDHEKDQRRIRANLNTLRKTKGNQQLIADLSRKLADLETTLGKLSGRLVELSEREAELENQMKVLISSVSLEAKQPKP